MKASVSFNFIVSVISRVITGGINVFLVSFLTRALSQNGYGEYNLIFAYLAIFLALTDLGLYSYLIRKISQETEDESNIIGNIITLRLFSNFCFLGIAFAVLVFMPYSLNVKIGVVLGSLFLISSSIIQILTAIYQKYLKMTDFAVMDVIFRVIYLISCTIIYYFYNNILLYILTLSLVELFHLIAVFLWAKRITPIKLNISFSIWKNSIVESYPIAVSLFFVLLYFKFDTILLSFYRPAEDVAVYSLGYKILEAIIFFPAMYIGIVMPHLAKSFVSGLTQAREISFIIWRSLWIGALPTSFAVFLYSKDIIRLFTPDDFLGADIVLKILALAMIPIFLGNLGGNALIAAHLQKKAMKIYGVAAFLNILGNIIFMPKYGYYSAAFMTLFTEIFVTTSMFVIISRYLGSYFPIKNLAGLVLVNLLFISSLWCFDLSLWFAVFAYLSIYPVILLVFKLVDKKDIMQVFENKI